MRTPAQEKRWKHHRKMLDEVGWNVPRLARRLGVSAAAIYQRFNRMQVEYGEEKNKYYKKLKVIKARDLRVAMKDTGYDLTALAKKLKLPVRLVRVRAIRLGLMKQSEPMISYPLRIPQSLITAHEKKANTIENKTGVRVSLAECQRAGLESLLKMSADKVFELCMLRRETNWRLRGRPMKEK